MPFMYGDNLCLVLKFSNYIYCLNELISAIIINSIMFFNVLFLIYGPNPIGVYNSWHQSKNKESCMFMCID